MQKDISKAIPDVYQEKSDISLLATFHLTNQ